MYNSSSKVCTVEGCESRQARGKEYCLKHLKERKAAFVITKEMLSTMRSSCCDAHCVKGEKHDYGEYYCKKCERPCIWKMGMKVAPAF